MKRNNKINELWSIGLAVLIPAFGIACFEGGGSVRTMSVSVTYPSTGAKPYGKPDQPAHGGGIVTLQDVHSGFEYSADYTSDDGDGQTFLFSAGVPAGVTLLVTAARILNEGAAGETEEQVELIIPNSAIGTEIVDTASTQAAAIVRKRAANSGIELSGITQGNIESALEDANEILAGTYLDNYDFSNATQQEITDVIVDYAIMLAVTVLMDQYAADWDAAYGDFGGTAWNTALVAEAATQLAAVDVTTELAGNTTVPAGITLADVETDVTAETIAVTDVETAGEFTSTDSGTTVVVTGGGDSATVTFSGDIQPILSVCACHRSGNTSGGLSLDSWASMIAGGNSNASNPAVAAGDGANSLIYQKVSMDTPPIGSRMPLGGPYLSADDQQKIKGWIDQGALNN